MQYRIILLSVLLPLFFNTSAQRGYMGDVTISNNSIINEYTFLTADASQGSTSISVQNSTLNDNNRFANALAAGDLLLLIQMQGVDMQTNISGSTWGEITAYNDCGNYEYVEVNNVSGTNLIQLRCGLINSYTASGRVQVIRVPRYNNLTVNAEITAPAWNGSTGGVIASEVLENLTLNSAGSFNADTLGFRGAAGTYANSFYGVFAWATNIANDGGAKGESVFGFTSEYSAVNGTNTKGAPANGGGGGNAHNGGGGGGGNAGTLSYNNGVGNPNPVYNTAWSLENPSIAGITSSGGGKGGYTFSGNNANELNLPPGDAGWGGDFRRNEGGRGGRSVDYSSGKIFLGGGGGAGDINQTNNFGASGGNGGGIVLSKVYGDVLGNGNITANGADGEYTSSVSPPFSGYSGGEGAGGGGAGGTVLLDVSGSVSNLNIETTGGNGGIQEFVTGTFFFGTIDESQGPGGGGGGGYIAFTSGTPITNVSGGMAGTNNSPATANFPVNGATDGGVGIINNGFTSTGDLVGINDTICAGTSATLAANVLGGLTANSNLIWYDAPVNGNFIGAGNSFVTGNIFTDSTFYVGLCPGNYTIPVSVIIGTSFSSDTSIVVISDENCGNMDGSITGILVTGGAQPLQYEWNGVLTSNPDLNQVSAGAYTLVVTDNNGCAGQVGTFIIGENIGPVLDTTNYVLTNEHCGQSDGSITGILATSSSPITYEWNGISSTSADIIGLSAGNYTLVVTDTLGCSDSTQFYNIVNLPTPFIDTSNILITDESCGQVNGSIENIMVTGSGVLNYTWSPNVSDTTLDVYNLSAGIYNVTVTDAFSCSASMIGLEIDELSGPTAGFIISPSSTSLGDTTLFTDTSTSDVVSWLYVFDDGNMENSPNPSYVFNNRGTYEICLVVENSIGCADTTCQFHTVNMPNVKLPLPNIFTPNGDGENDLLFFEGLDTDYMLTVFNRWGQVIYSASPYYNNWDGKNSAGKSVPEGAYYFILSTDNANRDNYCGYVELIR